MRFLMLIHNGMKSIFCFFLCMIIAIPFVEAQVFDAPQINPFSLTIVGVRSSPALVDIDNDGDLDLFTGYESGNFGYYENTGSANLPLFGAVMIDPFSLVALSGNTAPFLVDLDNDGDFDMMAGSDSGLRYFENIGNAANPNYGPAVVNPFSIISPAGNSKPYLVDIDNDNDLDLFVGASDGNSYYYENTGAANNPQFATAITNPFGLSNVGTRSAPSFVDIDKDNDLDAFVGNRNPGDFYYFENTGTQNAPNFIFDSVNPFNLENADQDAKPYFGDLDSDGDLDLLSGNANGEYYYFENTTPLSIDDLHKQEIYVIPNPFHNYTTVHLPVETVELAYLVLTDLNGREVLRIKCIPGIDKIIIRKGNLSNGLYIALLERSNTTLLLGKLLIK